MENERELAGSSLYGEGDDMLISGGRSLDDTETHKTREIVGEGKGPSGPSVVSEDSYEAGWGASNLLTRSVVEALVGRSANYWIEPTGGGGEFMLDL